ncbi:uncharacterized protein L203_102737 [Cryptococcus depauperatus CBS 7841]|uniref:Uncharacterized protein n=1 Tax=Cryptococcus depauperatus CBS 7841 TaxID=1295531 RepID=A0AAJ8JSC5_9TREE
MAGIIAEWEAKIDRIGEISSKLATENITSQSVVIQQELVKVLDQLALALRDDLLQASGRLNQDVDILNDLIMQIGRVGANLVVESDINSETLAKCGYIDAVLSLAFFQQSLRPHRCDQALVAGLYNMIIQENNNLRVLCLMGATYLRYICSPSEQTSVDLNVAQWIWDVLLFVFSNDGPESVVALDKASIIDLMSPLAALVSWNGPLLWLETLEYPEELLRIIHSSCQITEIILTSQSPLCQQLANDSTFLLQTIAKTNQVMEKHPLDIIMDVLEFSELPDSWTASYTKDSNDEENNTAEDSGEKEPFHESFRAAKAFLIHGTVAISNELSSCPNAERFWARMRRWLYNNEVWERKDLLECALLSFGNSVIDDRSAERLLLEDAFLSRLKRLFKLDTPDSTQHALVGVLKNLSIPERNKKILFQSGILDEMVAIGIWSPKKDLLQSVQGGAVVIFKHLCKNQPEISFQLLSKYKDDLLIFLERTDDPAIKYEGTRIFVNSVKNIPKDASPSERELFKDGRIAALMVDMFVNACQYPLLRHEAILGLALLAMTGSIEIVKEKMLLERVSGSGKEILETMLVDSTDDIAEELKGNADTLSKLLRQPE